MKKIVAIVLAMVMVLGLATTAMAATSYNNLYLKATDGSDIAETATSLTTVAAKAVKYDKVTGDFAEFGNIAYLVDTDGVAYVQVNSLADADYVAYADAAGKIVKFYLATPDAVEYKDGAAFTNFGEKCGQVNEEPEENVAYYTVKGEDFAVYAAAEDGDLALMVNGKLVLVNAAAAFAAVVPHTVVTEMENGKVVKMYCSVCNKVAVEAPNAMSVPKGADQADLAGNWYWAGVSADAAGDKVESAQTFDAGIAMYVGMSVMAAAGSAVVLKKKD